MDVVERFITRFLVRLLDVTGAALETLFHDPNT
jgi:hypothetical protein